MVGIVNTRQSVWGAGSMSFAWMAPNASDHAGAVFIRFGWREGERPLRGEGSIQLQLARPTAVRASDDWAEIRAYTWGAGFVTFEWTAASPPTHGEVRAIEWESNI